MTRTKRSKDVGPEKGGMGGTYWAIIDAGMALGGIQRPDKPSHSLGIKQRLDHLHTLSVCTALREHDSLLMRACLSCRSCMHLTHTHPHPLL